MEKPEQLVLFDPELYTVPQLTTVDSNKIRIEEIQLHNQSEKEYVQLTFDFPLPF